MKQTKLQGRQRRHARVRKTVRGDAARPRLAVFRSNKHIYAQVIDDASHVTIAAASTVEAEGKAKKTGTVEAAKLVGERVAQRAQSKGITAVVFDRGGYKYHGRVAAVADGARGKGLTF